MPEEKAIAEVLGDYMAREAEKERGFLQNLGHDADVFVLPEKSINGMAIYVQKKTKQPIVAVGNMLAEIVKGIVQEARSKLKPLSIGTISFAPEDFGYKLYAKALSLKMDYNQLKRPRIAIPKIKRVRDVKIITPTPLKIAS